MKKKIKDRLFCLISWVPLIAWLIGFYYVGTIEAINKGFFQVQVGNHWVFALGILSFVWVLLFLFKFIKRDKFLFTSYLFFIGWALQRFFENKLLGYIYENYYLMQILPFTILLYISFLIPTKKLKIESTGKMCFSEFLFERCLIPFFRFVLVFITFGFGWLFFALAWAVYCYFLGL